MTHAEEAAKRIYELMRFDEHGNRIGPDWVDGGNSVRQDQARHFARIGFECAAQYLDELVAKRAEQGIKRGAEYMTAAASAIRVRVGL